MGRVNPQSRCEVCGRFCSAEELEDGVCCECGVREYMEMAEEEFELDPYGPFASFGGNETEHGG